MRGPWAAHARPKEPKETKEEAAIWGFLLRGYPRLFCDYFVRLFAARGRNHSIPMSSTTTSPSSLHFLSSWP
jgi:hypothetical protein